MLAGHAYYSFQVNLLFSIMLKTVELVKGADTLSPKSEFRFGYFSTMTAFQSLVIRPLLPLDRQAIQLCAHM